MNLKISIVTICLCNLFAVQAQQATNDLQLPDKAIAALTKKYKDLDKQITRQTERYINSLEKQEKKLQKQLHSKDSVQAQAQLASMQQHYQKLRARLHKAQTHNKPINEYLPQLDSITNAAKFLQTSCKGHASVQELNATITKLQSKLQAGAEIKRMMKERKDLLRQQLKNIGVTNQLDAIGKETYYYKQQLGEYKALLKDKDKAREKVLGLVRENKQFKEFMSKNGFLGKLFPQAGAGGSANNFPVGLPTRQDVLNELQQKFGKGTEAFNVSGGNFLQQQLQKAKKEVGKLQQKANDAGNGVSDADMPNFKPNTQKGKSFMKRLEFGVNIQSTKGNSFLPTTSDIALTVGYKLNDKSTVGIGGSYKLGWGSSWQDIQLSTQGLGLRTYIDYKAPVKSGIWGRLLQNIWLSGGFEWNYLPELEGKVINSLASVNKNKSPWQQAGLIGLSKKYSKGKKKAQVQLLYNILYKQSYPQPQPLLFRVGWGL